MLPVSTEASKSILFPLAQPNKAIGLESHIGSWLAGSLEPPVLLAQLHEPRASNHHRDMKPRRQTPQLAESRSRNMRLAHSVGLDARRTASPHWGARESFSLDIPSHRTSRYGSPLSECLCGCAVVENSLEELSQICPMVRGRSVARRSYQVICLEPPGIPARL